MPLCLTTVHPRTAPAPADRGKAIPRPAHGCGRTATARGTSCRARPVSPPYIRKGQTRIDNKITARLTADYAPKADLEAANTAKSEAEAALAAANDKYKDVDIDALRADAEKYKAEAAQARKDADERVAAVQFDGKLDAAITAAHGRSAKAIRALLDVDTLKGSDKQDEAITAALAALQKDSGYLFESGETPPPYAAGTGSTALHGADADTAMRQAMGLPIDN